MNLQALRYFYEAFRYQSLTEASKELHISQPALTKHIKNIEKEFQVNLVKKVGRQIELTDLGLLVFEEAASLFQQEKQIELLLNNKKKQVKIIGTTQLNSEYLMKSLLANDKTKQFSLKFITENSQTLISQLQNNYLDFAILPKLTNLSDFEAYFLFTDELILVAHPDYCPNSITQDELCNYYFIKREHGSFLQQTLEEKQTLSPDYSLEVSGQSEALTACQLKQGIYLTSSKSVSELIASETLKKVSIEDVHFEKRDFYLYCRKDSFVPQLKKEVVSALKKEANE